ncbi:hypothetical protein [Streptomyces sp. NPDC001536]|uniref:hypothetical protein n=1 Tax=Streptomyces sp. NPDC001536 TaxID=3364583 RepID=UPI0036900C99
MTLSQHGPAFLQVAPAHTPPDAGPDVWTDLGAVSDFRIDVRYATVDIDLMSLSSWRDLLSPLHTIGPSPHPACRTTRQRIVEDLRDRHFKSLLQTLLHSYRPTPFPAPITSYVNPW